MFVRDVPAALKEIRRQAAQLQEGDLDNVRQMLGGREPRWVIQQHVRSKLVCGGRKFHLRAYLVFDASRKTMLLYRTFEVRIAAQPYPGDPAAGDTDAPAAHITNGAGGTATERCLLEEVSELRGVATRLEAWLARLFDPASGLGAPMLQRLSVARGQDLLPGAELLSYGLCALDIMIDSSPAARLWLLECNSCPGAPPREACSPSFMAHLNTFAASLLNLTIDGGAPSGVWERLF